MTGRLVGKAAVDVCRRQHPDLLPSITPPLSVAAPSPPLLETGASEEERVAFLVEAYQTFCFVHLGVADAREARIRSGAALGSSPQGRAARRKLTAAARVMAGEGWGELAEVVESGKLPHSIAPHSWLLYSAQAHFSSTNPRLGVPSIESLFSVRRLLSADNLRVYSHVASDLRAGAVRPGATWLDRSGIGRAAAALRVREQLIYDLGFTDRTSALANIAARGDALAGVDLTAMAQREVEEATRVEAQIAALALRGTWVWGRWIDRTCSRNRALYAAHAEVAC